MQLFRATQLICPCPGSVFRCLTMIFMAVSLLWATGCAQVSTPVPRATIDPPKIDLADHVFYRRTLANGLRAIAVQDTRDSVSVFVVVGAGNRQETEATTGLAHLVEHAMYTGTPGTGPGEHDRRVSAMGGQSNAFTREDYTLYYDHEVPVGRLREVLRMEADRLQNLNFDETAFLEERERLRHEEEKTWQPSQYLAQLIDQIVFTRHPYAFGRLSKQGHTRAVNLGVAQAKDFYHQYYRPDRVAVVVVGNIDPVRALEEVEATWSHLQPGPKSQTIAQEPDIEESQDVNLDWELSGDRLEWVWLGPERAHPDRIALELLADLISRKDTAQGVPYEAIMGSRQDRDLFRIGVTGAANANTILTLVEEISGSLVDEEILGQIKRRYIKSFLDQELRYRPYFSLAGLVAIYEVAGQTQQLVDYEQTLAAITPQKLQAVARRYLDPAKRVSIRFSGTGKEDAPLPQDLSALHRAAEAALQEGNLDRAIAAYSRLLAMPLSKMNRVIYTSSRGQVKMLRRDYRGAVADFTAALDIVDYPALRELLEEALLLQAGIADRAGGESSDLSELPAENSQAQVAAAGKKQLPKGNPQRDLDARLAQVMKRLEAWRELRFSRPVIPEHAPPQKDKKLAGWYEIDTARLVLVEGRSEAFSRGALTHELLHALQDQNWNLLSLQQQALTTDQKRALEGLIEGEAMLAVAELLDYDFEQHTRLPATGPIERSRYEKIFNYGSGLKFVNWLRSKGGWAAVDQAWKNPPRSTAQVLHPEGYSIAQAQAIPFAPVAGELLQQDEWGEFELRWLLVKDESTRAMADQLASMLVQDRVQKVRRDDGAIEEHWDLRLGSGADVRQFLQGARVALVAAGWEISHHGRYVRLSRLVVAG